MGLRLNDARVLPFLASLSTSAISLRCRFRISTTIALTEGLPPPISLKGIKLHIGANPQRRSYASYASFTDPDGNGWLLQEVTVRLPADPATRESSFTPKITNVLRQPRSQSPTLGLGNWKGVGFPPQQLRLFW